MKELGRAYLSVFFLSRNETVNAKVVKLSLNAVNGDGITFTAASLSTVHSLHGHNLTQTSAPYKGKVVAVLNKPIRNEDVWGN
jgi:hypothetical protein